MHRSTSRLLKSSCGVRGQLRGTQTSAAPNCGRWVFSKRKESWIETWEGSRLISWDFQGIFFFVGFRWDYLGLQLRWLWNQAEHQQQWKSFTILDYIWYLLLISSTWNHVKPALVDYTTNKNVDVTSWLLWMGIESDMTGVDLNSNVLWYDVSFKTCSNHRNISRRYDHYTDKEKNIAYHVLSSLIKPWYDLCHVKETPKTCKF